MASSFVPWSSGRADVTRSISVNATYDNNAYGSHAEEGDTITRVVLHLGGQKRGDRSLLEYYYTGSGNIFAQSGTRSFAVSSVGIAYARQLGEGRNSITAGGNISLRVDRSYYDVYDYAGVQGAVNGKWYILPNVLLRTGYRVRWRNYWNLDAFTYGEHYIFARLTRFLSTRTSLRGDISFGYKNYRGPVVETVAYGPFRRGPRWTQTVVVEPGIPDEGQVVLGLQVAQSLAENTGLRLRYQARLNTSSERYYLPGEESGYSEDEDIFSDRYDYEGHEWTARLTQHLPWGLRLVLGGGYELRDYEGRDALDLAGLPVDVGTYRKDRSTFTSLLVEVPLSRGVSAGILYGFERNRSNDAYYNYGGRHSLSVGLDIEL
jgi:hypothetical protein